MNISKEVKGLIIQLLEYNGTDEALSFETVAFETNGDRIDTDEMTDDEVIAYDKENNMNHIYAVICKIRGSLGNNE